MKKSHNFLFLLSFWVFTQTVCAASVDMRNGVLYLDGKPQFVWSAEYPYYRDSLNDWSEQLDNLKRMNVNIVTFSIPWRHHGKKDPLIEKGTYDFSGISGSNTNVLEFIRLIKEKDMYCIIRLGPYVGAGLNNGGLPDYVLPLKNPSIELAKDLDGIKVSAPETEALPAPLDTEYLKYLEHWFGAVSKDVVVPNQYPKGPILIVQILNDGVYSKNSVFVLDMNYSFSAVDEYCKFMESKYKKIFYYNKLHALDYKNFLLLQPVKNFKSSNVRQRMIKYIDWAEFHAHLYRKVLTVYTGYLKNAGVNLPLITDVGPALSYDRKGLEALMGRFGYIDVAGIAGFAHTGWNGIDADFRDKSVYDRFKLAAKSFRGLSMGETWGFSNYIQPAYMRTMSNLMWGATGSNLYPGVATDDWNKDLAPGTGSVFTDNNPVSWDKTFNQGFWTAHQMGSYFNSEGSSIIEEEPEFDIAWALYRPYCWAAVWDGAYDDWTKIGFADMPRAAFTGWDSFVQMCEMNGTKNNIIYIMEESLDEMLKYKIIFFNGSGWIDEKTRDKIIEYVNRGGVFVMTSSVPELDDKFNPSPKLWNELFPITFQKTETNEMFTIDFMDHMYKCRSGGYVFNFDVSGRAHPIAMSFIKAKKIKSAYIRESGKGTAIVLGFQPWLKHEGKWDCPGLVEYLSEKYAGIKQFNEVHEEENSPHVEVQEYINRKESKQYVFISTMEDSIKYYKVNFTGDKNEADKFSIRLSPGSSAVVGFEKKRIRSAMIKGINDRLRVNSAPLLVHGEYELSAKRDCDIKLSKNGSIYNLSVANVNGEKTEVTVPISADTIKNIIRIDSKGRRLKVKYESRGKNTVFTAHDMRSAGEYFENYALGKDALASASYNSNAKNAVDGDTESAWVSFPSDEEWIYIDLGADVTISEIVLKWGSAFERKYNVLLSDLGYVWRPVYTVNKKYENIDRIYIGKMTTRYIRIQGIKSESAKGYSLREIVVCYREKPSKETDLWIAGYNIYVKD